MGAYLNKLLKIEVGDEKIEGRDEKIEVRDEKIEVGDEKIEFKLFALQNVEITRKKIK